MNMILDFYIHKGVVSSWLSINTIIKFLKMACKLKIVQTEIKNPWGKTVAFLRPPKELNKFFCLGFDIVIKYK